MPRIQWAGLPSAPVPCAAPQCENAGIICAGDYMQPLIETNRAQLAQLCRKYHVRRLNVFGSATRADFDATVSDFDFLVEFEPIAPIDYAQAYFSLKEALEALFHRPVDLVTSTSVNNPYFRASLAASEQTVYAA